MANRAPISSRIRKDGGIKLLDINEQPLGYAQAKKRKKMLEMEEQQKKVAEAQAAAAAAASTPTTTAETSTTPEYAQGLASINPPATPVTPVASAPSYTTPTASSGVSTPTTPQTRTFLYTVILVYVYYTVCNKIVLRQPQRPAHLRFQLRQWLRHQPLSHQWKVRPSVCRQSDRLKLSRRYAYRLLHNLLMRLRTLERGCPLRYV